MQPASKLSSLTFLKLGFLEFALALVSVPMMALLPQHLSSVSTLSLSAVGVLLFIVRWIDACIDPWLGSTIVKFAQRNYRLSLGAMIALFLVAGMALYLIWGAPISLMREGSSVVNWVIWFVLLLALYLSTTTITLMFLDWNIRLSSAEWFQSRLVGAREGLGVIGLLIGSAFSGYFTAVTWTVVFVTAAALGLFWLSQQTHGLDTALSKPVSKLESFNQPYHVSSWSVFFDPFFRRWLMLYFVNGLASSVSATLIVLYLQDVLLATETEQGMLLALYFLVGLISIPAWIKITAVWGWPRAWRASSLGVVVFFAPALFLGPGDIDGFALVCVMSGIFVGADFVIPGAWLASHLSSQPSRTCNQGTYLGWWQFLKKGNLALSAGLMLPLLSTLGYEPGVPQPGVSALPLVYVVIPIGLKMTSALMLSARYFQDQRNESGHHPI